ncbi:hypothetical protein TNCV_2161221 [Trichonephila clavipes]|nr:hypothetical protein TNCV_2161221 [Trichonephila clavipes]
MLKSCLRNCVTSKCFKGLLEKIECPNKLPLPRHTLCNLCIPRNNKYWMGLVAWTSPHVYELVMSIATELEFIAEDYTLPVSHFPACPRPKNIQLALPMMWGQW